MTEILTCIRLKRKSFYWPLRIRVHGKYLVFNIVILQIFENLRNGPGYYSSALEQVFGASISNYTLHGVGLSGTCLAVCEYCAIIALKKIIRKSHGIVRRF